MSIIQDRLIVSDDSCKHFCWNITEMNKNVPDCELNALTRWMSNTVSVCHLWWKSRTTSWLPTFLIKYTFASLKMRDREETCLSACQSSWFCRSTAVNMNDKISFVHPSSISNMCLKTSEFTTGLDQWPWISRIYGGMLSPTCSNYCSAVNDETPLTSAVYVMEMWLWY